MRRKQNMLQAMLEVIFLIGIIISMPVLQVNAKQEKVVRVGWFQQPGYQEMGESGQHYGYNYEYLMQIAQHTGWKYEFVETDSFDECFSKLQNGAIDLMGCVIYTEERSKVLGLPRVSSGTVYTSLFVKKDSTLAPYDFDAFDGIDVACRESQNPVDLLNYAKENDFSVKLSYYKSVSEIEKAVLSGEVDAGVLGGYQSSEETRIVASFEPTPFYFACNQEDTELLRKLNQALDTIQIENSFYEKELSYKYLPEVKDTLRLTKDEEEYIKNQPKLTVIYQPDWYPISATNPETGEFYGVCADVFQRISELSGLQFEYLPKNSVEKNNKEELLACFVSDFASADAAGFNLTKSYLSIPLAVVWNSANEGHKNTVTAIPYSFSVQEELKILSEDPIVFYDSEQDCIEAVARGEAKRAYVNAYTVNGILATLNSKTLETSALHGTSCELSIAVGEELDVMLYSVLNKTLSQISDSEMNAIILKNTANTTEITLQTIIEQMPGDVLLFIGVLMFSMVVILILLLYARTKNAKKIKKILFTDELTGLLSLKGFEHEAQKLLKENTEGSYFIIDFDVNCFEEFNTINGYEAGNQLLQALASFAAEYKETNEICARIQADHFVCMIKGCNEAEIVDRVKKTNTQFRLRTKQPSLLISYGIYEITNQSMDIAAIRDCALQAKRTIKGNYDRFYAIYDDKLHKKQLDNMEIINRFEKALLEGELSPYFQPQYDSKTQRIIGAEALIRWFPPEGGMIPPDRFIGLLEKNGLIGKLDLFMFEQVCHKIANWCKENKPMLCISVNISQAHLYNPDFLNNLMEIVNRYKIPTTAIAIELTETAFLDNEHELISIMDKLHKEGFLVAMDDFGSGYSSLNMLKDLPFDIIKIDRGFLSSTSATKRGATVIQNILSLAKALNLHTVAEGVETKDQFEFLRENGCDVIQGYYFSKPVSEKAFEEMIEQEN